MDSMEEVKFDLFSVYLKSAISPFSLGAGDKSDDRDYARAVVPFSAQTANPISVHRRVINEAAITRIFRRHSSGRDNNDNSSTLRVKKP